MFDRFFDRTNFAHLEPRLEPILSANSSVARHGDLPKWLAAIEDLPSVNPREVSLNSDSICIGKSGDLTPEQHQQLIRSLQILIPWRKGPYRFFGIDIDCEWRSDWKWNRIKNHLSLSDKNILDIGCGNGYHCWRMLGEDARYVLGIDPSMRFQMQYQAARHFIKHPNLDLLPLGVQDLTPNFPAFDIVFSMGVLYHRRNPLEHIQTLKNLCTEDGGKIVLETLVLPDSFFKQTEHSESLARGFFIPDGRYAQMRNVWNLYHVDSLIEHCYAVGFSKVQCIDINQTTTDEQRSTDWMRFHSLSDFLDPNDDTLTREGLPRPTRATVIANC